MDWAETATQRLEQAGYRSGAARREVVGLLADQPCALTALEIDRRLDSVGRASVYRTLEQLEQLHLVHRVEIGGDAAGYERLDREEHHHHIVCEECGRLSPFASEALEVAIESVSDRTEFEIAAHDVLLRGTCPACTGGHA
ncbi:MAG TPA: Fur family transcriptional regulator [Solirubrobacterales bacterium]|nr:Fur family transcriptional regulator [Solirubrobacterales bacterium]